MCGPGWKSERLKIIFTLQGDIIKNITSTVQLIITLSSSISVDVTGHQWNTAKETDNKQKI